MEKATENKRACTVIQTADQQGPRKNSFHTPHRLNLLDTLLDVR